MSNIHANHADFPKGISMFLAASYIYLTFDGALEHLSLHRLYNLCWKPRDAEHQLHSHPARRETRLKYPDVIGAWFML